MTKDIILTGIRVNSDLHLGNYLGAILPMAELQKKYLGQKQLNMFIPDLHSIAPDVDFGSLHRNTIKVLKYYIAAGLDFTEDNTYIYRQSRISAHSELAWILQCFAYMGELSRMTQYKDKSSNNNTSSQNNQSHATVGLFTYPILMAADILLYNARWVPVGEDQRQHLELTRDLAIRINNKFNKEVFVIPEEWQKQLEFSGRTKGARIKSLKDPSKKMSKSIADPSGTILLIDSPTDAAKKIMSATTDNVGVINYDPINQPGITNLIELYGLITGMSTDSIVQEWGGKSNYGDFKKSIAEAVKVFLENLQAKIEDIDDDLIINKLLIDEDKLRKIAQQKIKDILETIGLY